MDEGLSMKGAFVTCLAMVFIPAHACSVFHNTANDDVRNAVKKNGWGFDNYEVVCEKLRKANAALAIHGGATVLSGKSIAWAAVGLKDMELMVYTDEYSGISTNVDDYASIDNAKNILMKSIDGAVNSMDIEKAIQSLEKSRLKARAAYSRK
jgi:hypothetical protein